MALSAALVWEVRSSGTANGGGAFNPTTAGVDYSQQDAAQAAYTDLEITSTTTNVTSSARPFIADDVGNILNITAGTGFTVGRYEIMSVSSGVATLDRVAGTALSTGGTATLGGAINDPSIAASLGVSDNTFWLRGTFTISSNSTATANGNVLFSNAAHVRGYSSVRGDNGKAVLSVTHTGAGNNLRTNGGHSTCANIRVVGTTKAGTGFSLNGEMNWNLEADTRATGFVTALDGWVFSSLAKDCGERGFGESGRYFYCVAIGCGTNTSHSAFAGRMTAVHCIAIGCTGNGFSSSTQYMSVVNCIAIDNAQHGFYRQSQDQGQTFFNCLAVGNGGVGFRSDANTIRRISGSILFGCAGYDNAGGDVTGNWGTNLGFDSLTEDPFVDQATGDYRLNEDPAGGAVLFDGGFPGAYPGLANTANHTPVGATGPEDFGVRIGGGRLYPAAFEAFLGGDVDLAGDDVKAAFVLDSYAFDPGDEFLDDVDVAVNGETANLGSKSITGGVFDAADATATPDTAQDIDAIVIYVASGDPTTSPLLAYISGFTPFTSDGSPISIEWSDGAEKIFALSDRFA